MALLVPATLPAQSGSEVEIERHAWGLHPSIEIGGELDLELAHVQGGVDPGASGLANFDLLVDVDTQKAGWWRGGKLHFYLLADAGSGPSPSERAGDLQVARNIEAPDDWKLYEGYLEQRLSERTSLIFGLHDMNSVFDDVATSALFHHSSFGIQPDISQTGPSIFPVTALGAILISDLDPEWLLETGIYDGVPGDANHPRGTQIKLDPEDGLYAIGQLTWRPGGGIAGKGADWAVAGWYHTAEFQAPDGRALDSNWGFVSTYESHLWQPAAGGDLSVFAQVGWARADRNAIARYLGAGLVWTGALPGRPDDRIGLGAGRASLAETQRASNPGLPDSETILELLYAVQLAETLSLEPSLQWIWNPAAIPGASDARLISLRLVAQF